MKYRSTFLSVLLILLSIAASSQTMAAGFRVGIAPSLPEPVEEDLEEMEAETMEEKIKKGLRVKKRNEPEEEEPDQATEVIVDLPTKYEAWAQVLKHLTEISGIEMQLVKAKSQLNFELGLAKGVYDFAYITPLQFAAFKDHPGYKAIIKRKAQPLRGIVYVKKSGTYRSLTELRDQTFVFPGALNFPGSVAIRSSLERLRVNFTPKFMPNHAQTYAQVAIGNFVAGGGTRETFRAQPPEIRNSLLIIWDSPGYSPYPFVAHPRIPAYTITKLQKAMVNMVKDEEDEKIQELMRYIFVNNGFETARNSDWDEIDSIDLIKLNGSVEKITAPEPEIGE